ncbi:MAG: hypothetical protein GXP49_08330 [Deltaproteobacteria bacterium]|nr:hypothetical protein [Deltaproteobacteria bacterium]
MALGTALTSCQWNVGTIDVYLAYNAVPEKNPLKNVDKLKMRIEGPDMMPREKEFAISSKAGSIGNIPPGKDRILSVEGIDRSGRIRSRGVSTPFEVEEGRKEIYLFFSNKGEFSPPPSVSGSGWKANYTTEMRNYKNIKGRAFSAVQALPNGLLLITGGADPAVLDFLSPLGANSVIPTAELFDPTSGAFVSSVKRGECDEQGQALCMQEPRVFHTAGYVNDLERILVIGGEPITSPYSEIFDPVDFIFTPGPAPNIPRSRHVAGKLPGKGGSLVIAGGRNEVNQVLDSIEIFDSNEQSFVGGPPLGVARRGSRSVSTGNGVVVTGGFGDDGDATPTRQVDLIRANGDGSVSVDTYSDCLRKPRAWHTAVVVEDKDEKQVIFICGGISGNGEPDNTCECLDPETMKSEMAPENVKLFYARWGHTATVLPDQKVLVAGGFSTSTGSAVLQNAVLLDPVGGEYNLGVLPMNAARAGHSAALLTNGMVVLVGGVGQGGQPSTPDYEIYNP